MPQLTSEPKLTLTPNISLRDISLDNTCLGELRALHFQHLRDHPEVCIELPRLMTEYMKDEDKKDDSPELRAGKRIEYILEKKDPIITEDKNLLAGTTTTKPIGVMIHPDFMAETIWPELETVHRRKKNPYRISKPDIECLSEIFRYWMDETILEKTRRSGCCPSALRMMEHIAFFLCSKPECISHTIPNYVAVVSGGLNDLKREAEDSLLPLGTSQADRKRADFYKAVGLAIDGVLKYAQRLSAKAGEMAARETNMGRKRALQKMHNICRDVPARKPQSFQEALQAIWICKVALHQENANLALSLGRLDQILYPSYAKDILGGDITVRDAVELVGCLWLKIADHVPLVPQAAEELFGGSGSNQAVTLGGVKLKDGDTQNAVNDLTYVMLRATELLRLRDPNVNCRYYPGVNPYEYLHRLCEVNVNTHATPCFHNDPAVIQTLQGQSVSLEHALDYGIVGCVEPVSSGRTFGHPGAILLNLTAALEMSLFRGKHRLTGDESFGAPETPAPEVIPSFDEFKKTFEKQLNWLIDQAVTANNCFGEMHQELHPTPLLSAMTEGCMASGKDVVHGGAVYNSSGVAVIGLAEVVDSLSAIQKFVFQEKSVTWDRMMGAIRTNWKDEKALQTRIRAYNEKFGTDSVAAQDNADYVMDLLDRTLRNRSNYRGGKYTVGYWTMTYHAGMGRLTCAFPSGRMAGESLPSGITPVSGSAPDLPSCLNFVAKLDHTKITNGQALNLKFTPLPKAELTITKLADTINAYMTYMRTCMRNGGLQVQCNIIDRVDLEDAQSEPDKHSELLVRVSGYTAYFTDLNATMQNEVIERAEYNLP